MKNTLADMATENAASSSTAEPTPEERAKDTTMAVNLMAQGKRNLICGEIPAAVNQFQDACQLLSKNYGEMAKECAEAYFCYGRSLLDLARMETGVLGNALQGVDVEDEETADEEKEEKEDQQFENANKLPGEEREKLREEVLDAMAEEKEGKKDAKDEKKDENADEKPKDEKKEGEKPMEESSMDVDDAKPAEGEKDKAQKGEKPSEKDEKTSEKDKKPSEKGKGEKMETVKEETEKSEEKTENAADKNDKPKEKTEKPAEKKEKTEEKPEKETEKAEDKTVKAEDKTEKAEEGMDTTENPQKTEEKKEVSKEEKSEDAKTEVKPEADSKNPEKKEEVQNEEKPKVENGDVEMAEKDPDTGESKEEEKTEGEEGEEEEEECEEGEEDDEAEEEGEDGETKTEEDPDDVSNLQLAWEMLELAKMIYLKDETKEAQLRAAEAYLKLGEVSLETEQYDQAIADFKDCLKIQESHLEPEDRLLAESHYQLGLAYGFMKQFNESIDHYRAAIKTIESKIGKLELFIKEGPKEKKEGESEGFEDPIKQAEQEIKDLKEILPDIRAKIEDTVEDQKSIDQLKDLTKEALGGKMLGEEADFGSAKTSSNEPEKKASDISHLIRKKRKPSEDAEADSDNKKAKQDITSGGDAKTNGVEHKEADKDKAKEAPTESKEEAMATS